MEKGRDVAQLELDEEGEVRSRLALSSLSGLEFAKCPRCLQSVREKDVPAGHCLLLVASLKTWLVRTSIQTRALVGYAGSARRLSSSWQRTSSGCT